MEWVRALTTIEAGALAESHHIVNTNDHILATCQSKEMAELLAKRLNSQLDLLRIVKRYLEVEQDALRAVQFGERF